MACVKNSDGIKTLFNDTEYLQPRAQGQEGEVSNKKIYQILLENYYRKLKFEHTCVRLYSEGYIGLNIPWEKMWKLSYKTFCTHRSYEITWLFCHNALYTGDKIKKMYPHFHPTCKTCNSSEVEHILHVFVQCKFVWPTWKFFTPFLMVSFSKTLRTMNLQLQRLYQPI